ncbi:hypothetical protein I302_103223 [Kwoniella bestiolae CBS 10118]|uniref:Ig-like domain-containing protein n=1 Tax=Kwoniella bestiolae CBS 10118 TaxID=1296100 RepID=A0A1B9G7S6_9TREE|nr:hypothetical protein I302_01922 [Kwoniella bestiolae CBS 10118]OCF27087.1 hypothetical protein I302_01922 [Kwoniella bestiolae CBS 10118]
MSYKTALFALVALLASPSARAQSTVSSSDGTVYDCSDQPSAIPAYSDACPQYLTTNTGSQWPLSEVSVSAIYNGAPTSYSSSASGDIYMVCNWRDPSNSGNLLGCKYDGGAATGSKFSSGTLYNGAGTGIQQACPTIQYDKPRPSPGLNYRKRLLPTTQFACPTTQTTDGGFLITVDYVTNNDYQSTFCTFHVGSSNIGCTYQTDGTLQYAQAQCPTQLCQAAKPYTRRRRGLPQPADRLQTSREQIIARRKAATA